jgi:hypothetical protein
MTNLFSTTQKDSGPVECLGQTFPSEQARREHFTKLLAEKLKDPAFRKIEGFPQGTDEAILAMSDPPYYTPSPTPFLDDSVRHTGKPNHPRVSTAASRRPSMSRSARPTRSTKRIHTTPRFRISRSCRRFCITRSRVTLCWTALAAPA